MPGKEEWQALGGEIKAVLAMDGWPVAVTYSLDAPPLAGISRKKGRVCDALLVASRGDVQDITKKSSACNGGTFHLGLGPRPVGADARPLKEFLINGEKLYCSLAAYHRSTALAVPPPLGLADHVILAPLNKAELKPDVVVFIVNAEQACRLVTLDTYDTGIPPRPHMCGATCYQVIAYPLVSGELNVSLMDYTSRRIEGYGPGDLFVAAPYHRFLGITRSIPHCTAGTARMEVPASFRRQMEEGEGEIA